MPATGDLQSDFFREVADAREMLDVLERLPGALFMIKNLESRYIYMSRGLRESIHLRPGQEVVGKTDFDLFPKIVAQNFRENDLQVFRHDRPLVDEVHAAVFFSGAPFWAISSKYPLHDRSGRVIGLITINEPYEKRMGRSEELNRLLPAVDHITRHYAEGITVAGLARLCGFSESHFARIFRQRMKTTVHAFLEQVRMFHAIDAIKHSATPIAEIALDCGFYDPSSFVKRFKRFTGSTPLRYRKDHQGRLKTERAMALPGVG